MISDYVMEYKGVVQKSRYHEFRAGLLDANEIAILFQDMIEGNCLPVALVEQAYHFIRMGLCRLPDQMCYH